ncbi:MAG: RHS repeat-associated core domain-containing protein [Desulfocapsaceae bacterium]|nr:RHS repeat-associated core domain-containing protein [Desulfocapsaceae bacterium]
MSPDFFAQQLVTAAGAVVWQAAYLPFGKAQIATATVANNLRFAGQYFDAETGLHYNWNRFYDPEVGRYISADPIGLDGGMNLYAYVAGNPVNAVDPWGLAYIDPDRNYWEFPMGAPPSSTPLKPWNGNFRPGFDRQDDICSWPMGELNNNKCYKNCCKKHDDCYSKNGCNWSSWIGTFSAFPIVPACQKCNREAVKCISEAKLNYDDCECN